MPRAVTVNRLLAGWLGGGGVGGGGGTMSKSDTSPPRPWGRYQVDSCIVGIPQCEVYMQYDH